MKRNSLGVTLSAVRREADTISSFYDDPITQAYGVGSMFGADIAERATQRAETIVRADGYRSLADFVDEVEARTSARWVYFESGLLGLDVNPHGIHCRDCTPVGPCDACADQVRAEAEAAWEARTERTNR